MNIIVQDGKILVRNGKIATSTDCCCGSVCTCCTKTPRNLLAQCPGITNPPGATAGFISCLTTFSGNFFKIIQGDPGDCVNTTPDPEDFPCDWRHCTKCFFDDGGGPVEVDLQQQFDISCDDTTVTLDYQVQVSRVGFSISCHWTKTRSKTGFVCTSLNESFCDGDRIICDSPNYFNAGCVTVKAGG